MIRTNKKWQIGVTAGAVATVLVTTACSGAGGGGGSGSGGGSSDNQSINVLMVANPQMTDIQKLTDSTFTKDTGIKVNFTVLPENELRDKVTQDVASQAGQYDLATVGAYETQLWTKNGWLHEMSSYADADSSYDASDLIKPVAESLTGEDGKLYALPFYGESSFLMYRKDVMKEKGLTMPEHPTWAQVADIAAKLDGAEPGMKGICLRGLPGWGEMGAPLTTVVNTMGGTWFDKDWNAQVNGEGFSKAANFYVDLVKKHGEAGAAQAGFTECLNALSQGKVAMWYDATSAAGSLEDPANSKVVGKIGYAFAPVDQTKYSGWLWSWNWAMPKTTKHADAAAKFALWATSKEYAQTVGEKLSWAQVPSGNRTSLYSNPDYEKAAGSFGKLTLESIQNTDPTNPGLQPRPTVGIQYVTIPEFADLGTKVTQSLSGALTGKESVSAALDDGQKEAEEVAKAYK